MSNADKNTVAKNMASSEEAKLNAEKRSLREQRRKEHEENVLRKLEAKARAEAEALLKAEEEAGKKRAKRNSKKKARIQRLKGISSELVAEIPVVEAPVVEAPVVEAPVVEAPVVEKRVSEWTKSKATILREKREWSNSFLGIMGYPCPYKNKN
jgi:hypothetical protein